MYLQRLLRVLANMEGACFPDGKGIFVHLFCSIPETVHTGNRTDKALKKISFYIKSPYDLELFLRNKPVLATAECFIWCGFELLLQEMEA